MTTYTHKDGRVFTLESRRPYIRKDGTSTTLAVWSTKCNRSECNNRLTVTVPGETDPSLQKAFATKHCSEHKLTKKECWALAMEARKKLQESSVP